VKTQNNQWEKKKTTSTEKNTYKKNFQKKKSQERRKKEIQLQYGEEKASTKISSYEKITLREL